MPRSLFDGVEIEKHDVPRLSGQLAKVYAFLKDGKWVTIEQVAKHAGCSEVSASTRMRDLRKKRFGGYTVERKRDRNRRGIFWYRLVLRKYTSKIHVRIVRRDNSYGEEE